MIGLVAAFSDGIIDRPHFDLIRTGHHLKGPVLNELPHCDGLFAGKFV